MGICATGLCHDLVRVCVTAARAGPCNGGCRKCRKIGDIDRIDLAQILDLFNCFTLLKNTKSFSHGISRSSKCGWMLRVHSREVTVRPLQTSSESLEMQSSMPIFIPMSHLVSCCAQLASWCPCPRTEMSLVGLPSRPTKRAPTTAVILEGCPPTSRQPRPRLKPQHTRVARP